MKIVIENAQKIAKKYLEPINTPEGEPINDKVYQIIINDKTINLKYAMDGRISELSSDMKILNLEKTLEDLGKMNGGS